MKWLTISQIKRRSKTAKGALKVSYEHWCQLYDATSKELREEDKRTSGCFILDSHCGLCRYHSNKNMQDRKCSLCAFRLYCPQPVWGMAARALSRWRNRTIGNNHQKWHTWKRASKAVRDKLKELMQE